MGTGKIEWACPNCRIGALAAKTPTCPSCGRPMLPTTTKDYDDDLPLFARGSDPETSHEAMAAYDRARLRSAIDVVVTLHREQLGGLADYELRAAFEARWQQPCCDHLYQQARSSARDKGLIRDSGERRVNPTTNRRQVVWEACAEAPPMIDRCSACGHVLRRR